MRISDQYIWNVLFLTFFLSLGFAGIVILHSVGARLMVEPSPMEFLILSLASFRLTRLFVYDKILAFFREQFWDIVETPRGKRSLEKPLKGPRRTMADLLSCPWCIGMWAGTTVVFFYYLTEYAWFPVMALAVAGLGSLFQVIANLIGWKAEGLKHEVEL